MLTLTGAGSAGALDTAPTNLVFSNLTTTSLTLSWTPGTGPTPDHYTVQRKLTSQGSGSWSTIGTPSSATINDSGRNQDESYDYRVSQHDAAGDSPYSSIATVVTLPGAPTISANASSSSGELDITFAQNVSDGSASVTFYIERSDDGTTGWSVIASALAAGASPYADTGLGQGTKKYYRSREHNAGGYGAYSSVVNATTKNAPGKARMVKGTPANGKIFFNFLAPTSGGTPSTVTVKITPSAGGSTITNSGLSYSGALNPDGSYTVVSGTATNGVAYDGIIDLVNSDGTGPDSDADADNTNITPYGFALTDLGTQYYSDFDAQHVTVTGGLVQDPIADQSGNGRDLSFTGSTRWSFNATEFNGQPSLTATASSGYKRSGMNDPFTGEETFELFINRSGNGHTFATTNDDTQTTDSMFPSDGLICFRSRVYDPTQPTGHKIKQWRNGDQSTTEDTNAPGALGNNVILVWGAASDGSSFATVNSSLARWVTIKNNLTGTQRQQVEGVLAWSFPFGHRILPNTHPWYSVSPTGALSAPSQPVIDLLTPGNGSVTVKFHITSENGANTTFTVTASSGPTATGDGSAPITVSGLTNGTPITVTVTATNAAGSTVSNTSGSVTPRSDSAVWQFKMNEASGNALNSIVIGQDLTAIGSPGAALNTDPLYPARTLNGTSQNFQTAVGGDITPISGDYTIEAWFMITSSGGLKDIVASRASPLSAALNFLLLVNGTTLVSYSGNGTGSFDNANVASGLSLNALHQVIGAYNHSTKEWRLRVDGGSVVSWTSAYTPTSQTSFVLEIGGSGSEYLPGSVGLNVGWSRKLSDSEMLTRWNGGVPLPL